MSRHEADMLDLREAIRQHIGTSEVEVIVCVEAIDPLSGYSFQARHSYTADDIVFDHTFVPCMLQGPDGRAKLDWAKFHALQEVNFNDYMIGVSHS